MHRVPFECRLRDFDLALRGVRVPALALGSLSCDLSLTFAKYTCRAQSRRGRMAMTGGGYGPDFADVYREQLLPVWRYVRSRIPDRHEAEDVTSDVFARAWRSWGRFDAGRGPVAPWLLSI